MSNNPLISVIMSTYNSEEVVKKSIESIVSQTYQHFELLIIDDASTDNTLKTINLYQEKHKNIKIYKNQKNIGLTKCLNILLNNTQGDYIARQDDDDISINTRLENQLKFIESKNLDFCTTRAITSPDGRSRPNLSYYLPKKILINYKNPFVHGTLMIKKNTITEIGGYDENFYYSQDYKLIYDLIKKGYKFKTLRKKLYILNTKNNISELKKDEQKYYALCVKNKIKPEIVI
ncbi:glycosyltransferase [Acidimicrobiia bacterium]|nr:glycosyltransferase [Acidimicrobiia bacterium]